MAEISVTAFKTKASAVISDVERGRAYLVTKRGRPSAVLLPVEEADDLILANAGELLRMRDTARAVYVRGRSRPLKELG